MEYEKTGKLIQALRKEKGLTQMALSEKLGVTDRAVSKWERGKSFPDVSMLKPLAEALDVSVSELLDGERRTPDKGNAFPDGAAVLTVEDADKAVMSGIRAYIHETQRKDRILVTIVLIAMVALFFAVRGFFQDIHGPVDFREADLEFSEILLVREDHSAQKIYLDEGQGAELKLQIQKVLREEMPEAEEMGKLKGVPRKPAKGSYVKLGRLVTLYGGFYYDQRSWEYYTFPDIERVQEKIYSLCRDWLAAADGDAADDGG